MRHRSLVTAAALAALLGLTLSCDSTSPTRVRRGAAMSIRVVDENHEPLPGARLEISYPYAGPPPGAARPADLVPIPTPPSGRWLFVSNNPCSLGAMRLEFSLPLDALCKATIVTRAGTPRRTLFDRAFPAGVHAALWDGTDDAGQPMPSGVYRLLLAETQGDSLFDFAANLLWTRDDPETAHGYEADARGRLAVTSEELGLGEIIEARDASGLALGAYTVGPTVRITAVAAAGAPARSGAAVTDLRSRDLTVTVRTAPVP